MTRPLSDDIAALFANVSNATAAGITPVADALEAKNRREAEARRIATEEAISKAVPGDLIAGEGVYLGRYEPEDRKGNSLGKVFNAFAAPEDLEYEGERVNLAYDETLDYLSQLKNWHGHDGSAYDNDAGIFKALDDGSYKGEWIIPPHDLLGELWEQRQARSLKDTLCTDSSIGSYMPSCYWSSTEVGHYWAYTISFHPHPLCNGQAERFGKTSGSLSCRPVRLRPVP